MTIKSRKDILQIEQGQFSKTYPNTSPYEILSASAANWPDNIAIHYLQDTGEPDDDLKVSYRELLVNVDAAAAVFRSFGVTKGKTVALISAHTPCAHAALWGAQKAGCAFPINPMLRPDYIAALLKASGACVLVIMGVNSQQDYWTDLVPALRKAGAELPILDCDGQGSSPGSDGCFEYLLEKHLLASEPFETVGNENSIAAYFHTGGTTAAPKLVQHSRLNEAYVARSCALVHGHKPDDVALNGFPLFHVAGAFVYGLSVLSAGGTLLVPGRLGLRDVEFSKDIWGFLERHNVTVICAVPTVLSMLLGAKKKSKRSSIRIALTGGSPLSPELADHFEETTGIGVRNIFGMTETAGAIALEPVHSERIAKSCGFPLPFCEAMIVPNDTEKFDKSRTLPAGETGIIAVRGPNVSPGYRNADQNSGTFEDDGWLLTGDLGEIDHEGRLSISGREKDVIIRGSHNIDPQSIEDCLISHDEVVSAAAIGMPDSYSGELPVAFVTVNMRGKITEAELISYLHEHIDEPAAMPKRIEILDEMPVTPIGKIFKPALRKIAIKWALDGVAGRAGIVTEDYSIAIRDNLKVEIVTTEDNAERLRGALTGMPIDFVILVE